MAAFRNVALIFVSAAGMAGLTNSKHAGAQFSHFSGCALVERLEPISLENFRQNYGAGKKPVVFPSSMSPSTREDAAKWSREGLLHTYGGSSFTKLGTNRSLSEQGETDSTTRISLEEYLNPEGSLQPGYMFITGLHREKLNRFEDALINDASDTIRQWQRGAEMGSYLNDDAAGAGETTNSLKQWEPVVAIGSANKEGAPASTGIPFHQHHAAWLHVLHGTKLWHLYPPTYTASSIPGSFDDGSNIFRIGHSEWIAKVLPTLNQTTKPLEYLQQPGETMYIPEGWWHATSNLLSIPRPNVVSVAVGGQSLSSGLSQSDSEDTEMKTFIKEMGRGDPEILRMLYASAVQQNDDAMAATLKAQLAKMRMEAGAEEPVVAHSDEL